MIFIAARCAAQHDGGQSGPLEHGHAVTYIPPVCDTSRCPETFPAFYSFARYTPLLLSCKHIYSLPAPEADEMTVEGEQKPRVDGEDPEKMEKIDVVVMKDGIGASASPPPPPGQRIVR